MTSRACKRCGRTIVFAEGPNGKTIPLEQVDNVYWLHVDGKVYPKDWSREDGTGPFISHFVSCPAANEFSGSRKVNVYGEPAWLNERVGFGKFKDRTWAQMATAQRRSKEANWLRWMDENLVPGERYPQHRERDERTLERIRYCLKMVDA